MILAKVYVSLKLTVNDPEGLTILNGLHSLGFASASSVRYGKYVELRLEEVDLRRAEELVKEMCKQLLANPVIEEYRYELERLDHGN